MPLIQNRPNASWLKRQTKNGKEKAGRKEKRIREKKDYKEMEDDQSELSLRTRESNRKEEKNNEKNNQR